MSYSGRNGVRTGGMYDVVTGEDTGEKCSCPVGDLSYSSHLKEFAFLICAPSGSLRTSSKYICMVS